MSVPAYVTVDAAMPLPGLRVAFVQGLPSPWSVAVRAIFEFKGLTYTAVAQHAGEANEALRKWTGQCSAPVAMYGTERPRSLWSELLLLAERLAPDPPLIPDCPEDRALMFGLCQEIGGEDGLGWSIRALLLAEKVAAGDSPASHLLARYSSGMSIAHSRQRLNGVISLLARRLVSQQEQSSDYLVGHTLSAADIYWVSFSNMVRTMLRADCVMPDFYLELGDLSRAYLDSPLPEILIEHRDRILHRHFVLPIEF